MVAFHYRSYGTFFLQQNRLHNIHRGFTHYKYYRARITILTKSTFRGVLFCTFLLNWCNWHSCCDFSRLQMWLQPDKVSCLKTLINTIISTFTDIQEFSLGCLFWSKNQEFSFFCFWMYSRMECWLFDNIILVLHINNFIDKFDIF